METREELLSQLKELLEQNRELTQRIREAFYPMPHIEHPVFTKAEAIKGIETKALQFVEYSLDELESFELGLFERSVKDYVFWDSIGTDRFIIQDVRGDRQYGGYEYYYYYYEDDTSDKIAIGERGVTFGPGYNSVRHQMYLDGLFESDASSHTNAEEIITVLEHAEDYYVPRPKQRQMIMVPRKNTPKYK